jgi:TonB-dependent SusC/RagA subfamily outer membrane receptor
MKRALLITLLVVNSLSILNAQSLANESRSSHYQFVYELTDNEACAFAKHKDGKLDFRPEFLHTLIDSVTINNSNSWSTNRKNGNYLLLWTEDDKLVYEMHSLTDIDVVPLNNSRDFSAIVYNAQGQKITNAKVKLNGHRVKFDKKLNCYRLRKYHKGGLLEVKVGAQTSFFEVEAERNSYVPVKYRITSFIIRNPVGYVTRPLMFVVSLPFDLISSIYHFRLRGSIYYLFQPFRDIRSSIEWGEPEGFVRKICGWFDPYIWKDNYNKPANQGYMVFSKPIYRPGDTVKFKAFVCTAKGKPINKLATVKFWNQKKFIELGKCKPYRPGAYQFSFVLNDSLPMLLDQYYTINLEDDDLENITSGLFKFEDYELKSSTFSLRSESETSYPKKPQTLYAKGVDENGLSLHDANVSISLYVNSISNPAANFLAVRDTLWTFSGPLATDSETPIIIPDSIWPQADVNYTVSAVFLSGSNERVARSLNLQYKYNEKEVKFTAQGDSLRIDYQINGISTPIQNVKITPLSANNNNMDSVICSLPAVIAVNPLVSEYEVYQKGILFDSYETKKLSDNLNCNAWRDGKLLKVNILNPRKLPLQYYVFHKRKLIRSGTGDTVNFAIHASKRGTYKLHVSYIFGGKAVSKDFDVNYYKNALNVKLIHPNIAYPGMQVPVNVLVTDANGKPVKNADVTVFANTSKFTQNQMPTLPYLGKINQYNYNPQNNFSEADKIDRIEKRQQLAYNQWNKKFELDSINWYKFKYPQEGIFEYKQKSDDGKSYLCPFLVRDGRFLPVEIVYINYVPVYFRQAGALRPYCFELVPNYLNTITLRSADCEVTFTTSTKSGEVKLLSVNAIKENAQIKFKEAEPKYTFTEQQLLNQHLIKVTGNYGNASAWLSQGSNYFQLAPFSPNSYNAYLQQNSYNNNYGYNKTDLWVGPLGGGNVYFNDIQKYDISTGYESGWQYEFLRDKVKMKEIKPFKTGDKFSSALPPLDFKTKPVTSDSIAKAWESYAYEVQQVHSIDMMFLNTTIPNRSVLSLSTENFVQKAEADIKNVRLQSISNNVEYLYPGNTLNWNNLSAGRYQLMLLLYDNSYLKSEVFDVKPNTHVYLRFDSLSTIYKADSFSMGLNYRIRKELHLSFKPDFNTVDYKSQQETQQVANQTKQPRISKGEQGMVSGYVFDMQGAALPGVTVTMKGSDNGVITDLNGHFSLNSNENVLTLDIRYIGFVTQTVTIENGKSADIFLSEDIQELNEVVVIGYGVQRKTMFTSSIQTVMQGRVAGVQISEAPGAADKVMVRGVGSVDGNSQPLYIIDGIVVSDPSVVARLNAKSIVSTQILKDEQATALYGSRGANGVVIIQTSKSGNDKIAEMMSNTQMMGELNNSTKIRNNFNDCAIWQPMLTTDNKGLASFKATLPDDITNWKVYALAFTDNRKNGTCQTEISSFKPLSAVLPVPMFIVQGDSLLLKGRVQQYAGDTMSIFTRIDKGAGFQPEKKYLLNKTLIEPFEVTTSKSDSLKVGYQMRTTQGYTDGEIRSIPVYRLGVEDVKGFFTILNGDTTLIYKPQALTDSLVVTADADLVQIAFDEIKHIKSYTYLCNEQISSKIKALLMEKRLCRATHQEFKNEQLLRELIQKLNKNCNADGLWGWWPEMTSNYWISLNAYEALIMAGDEGFPIKLDTVLVVNTLRDNFLRNNTTWDKTRIIRILGHFVPLGTLAKEIMSIKVNPKYDKAAWLDWMELRSEAGLYVPVDSLFKLHHTTLKGNIYWGSYDYATSGFVVSDNAWASMMMYRIIRNDSTLRKNLPLMRNWFLEQRKDGHWTNTYMSASILETILPEILSDSLVNYKPSLVVNYQGESVVIDSFPFRKAFAGESQLKVACNSRIPIYFSAWSRYFDENPKAKGTDFQVYTSFSDSVLQTGKPVTLKVKVKVKKAADYMMLEIPIPAGCSYENKNHIWRSDYTEYFRDRVAVFYSHLGEGEFTLEIKLLPRFAGKFGQNPARIEQMYFPIFNGQTDLKKVKIQENK